jgi:DNA primase small subunit
MKTLLLSANILRASLRELFGFKHFLYSYSGRRGLHISVLDRRAFDLSGEARAAIIARLSPPVSKHDPRLLFDVIATDPSFGKETNAAIDVAHHQLLKRRDAGGVGLLQLQRDRNKFVELLFDPSLLRTQFDIDLAASTRRAVIDAADGEACLAAITQRVSTSKFFSNRLKLIFFSIVWPVLDAGASRDGHLLKSEFSVHGSTDRIAVPFELDESNPVWDARLCPTATALLAGDANAVDAFEKGKRVLREAVERVKNEITGKRKRD